MKNEIFKEFYAQYGLAMHYAQYLEKGTLELLNIYRVKKNLITSVNNLDKQKDTFGQIIYESRKLKIIENSLIEELQQANNVRNYLAHNFWWKNNIEDYKEDKLIELNREIEQYYELFNRLRVLIEIEINKLKE